jgi:hypothetical protein
MRHDQLISRLMILLTFGCLMAGSAAAQSELSPEQKQKLKLLEAKLQDVPGSPASTDEHLPVVQKDFRDFLALTSRPSRELTNNLARTFVLGISARTISVPQSVGVIKELAKVLSQPTITPGDTFKFTSAIDPFIQGTGLDNASKMRLYREALRIVQTAPNYSYNQK